MANSQTRNYYIVTSKDDVKYYVQFQWKETFDLYDHEQSKIVCELTATDGVLFWRKDVTLGDIKSMQSSGIDPIIYPKLIEAAMAGEEQYDQHKLLCQVELLSSGDIEFIWRATLEKGLKFKLGAIRLESINTEDNQSRWHDWLDYLFNERISLKSRGDALQMRVNDLVKIKDNYKMQMENFVLSKLEAEGVLMLKFKDVLNAKKRKIRYLMQALENAGITTDITVTQGQLPNKLVIDENVSKVEEEEKKPRGRKPGKRRLESSPPLVKQQRPASSNLEELSEEGSVPTKSKSSGSKLLERVNAAASKVTVKENSKKGDENHGASPSSENEPAEGEPVNDELPDLLVGSLETTRPKVIRSLRSTRVRRAGTLESQSSSLSFASSGSTSKRRTSATKDSEKPRKKKKSASPSVAVSAKESYSPESLLRQM